MYCFFSRVIDGLRTPSVNLLRMLLSLLLTDLPYDFVTPEAPLPVYDFVVGGLMEREL